VASTKEMTFYHSNKARGSIAHEAGKVVIVQQVAEIE